MDESIQSIILSQTVRKKLRFIYAIEALLECEVFVELFGVETN